MIIAFTGAGISRASGIITFNERPEIRDYLTRAYAKAHPEKYREVMREFVDGIKGKEPNDAHYALAEYGIPVMTMNIDMLHQKAGSEHVVTMHGSLPNEEQLAYCDRLYNHPVLYGDPAPNYQEAYDWTFLMEKGDILLVVGASDYTTISTSIRIDAMAHGAEVVEIQENAVEEVRKFLESHKDKIESYEALMARKKKFEFW